MSVYFVRADNGYVKIGFATDVASRFSDLQVGSPVPLTLVGVIEHGDRELESYYHRHFACDRVKGEWFLPSSKLTELMAQHPVPQRKSKPLTTYRWIRERVFRMTQTDFAEALQVNQSTISRWESEAFGPSYEEMVSIRRAASERGLEWHDSWFFEIPAASSCSKAA